MYSSAVAHIYQATHSKLYCFSITIWFMLPNNSLMQGFYNPQFTNEAPGFRRDWVISQGHTAGNQQRQGSNTGHWTPNPKFLTTLPYCFWFNSLWWKIDLWRTSSRIFRNNMFLKHNLHTKRCHLKYALQWIFTNNHTQLIRTQIKEPQNSPLNPHSQG